MRPRAASSSRSSQGADLPKGNLAHAQPGPWMPREQVGTKGREKSCGRVNKREEERSKGKRMVSGERTETRHKECVDGLKSRTQA